MKNPKEIPVYLHPKALKVVQCQKNIVTAIGGRGWSKSTILGAKYYQYASLMPRSLGALWGLTYNQILTKVLPSFKKMLLNMGLKEDTPRSPGHFVIGRKPPRYFKALPYNEPQKWDNVLLLFNGSAIEFISVDRPDTGRGGSYDYMIVDEAVYMPKNVHDEVALYSIRGNNRYFKGCPFHGQRLYVSSQSWTKEGFWVEDQKYQRDKQGNIKKGSDGRKLTRKNVAFFHGTSWDNVAVLGEDKIRSWEEESPPLTYAIEIMSERKEVTGELFYERFNKAHHTYIDCYDYDLGHELSGGGVYVKKFDKDRNTKLPIDLSFDFGDRYNVCKVFQHHPHTNEVRLLNTLDEPSNKLITGLCKRFTDTYKHHNCKVVTLYGDPSGNRKKMEEQLSYYEEIAVALRAAGWTVHIEMFGRGYPAHSIKQEFINKILAETESNLPKLRINAVKCRNTINVMGHVKMSDKKKKDKSSERSKKIHPSQATHGSDALDYYLVFKFYKKSSSPRRRRRVRFGRAG